MSLTFALESIKFHKLKSHKFIQFVFVLVFAINALFLFFPIGDNDFSVFYEWMYGTNTNNISTRFLLPDKDTGSVLTYAHLLNAASSVVLNFINLSLSFLYGAVILGDFSAENWRVSLKKFVKRLLQIFVFTVLLVVPFLLGSMAFSIPYLILLSKLSFTVFYLFDNKFNLREGVNESFNQTNGLTINIVASLLIIDLVISLPKAMMFLILPMNDLSIALISGFFTAVHTLMIGRLLAFYYIYYSRMKLKTLIRVPMNAFDVVDTINLIKRNIMTGDGEPYEEENDDDYDEFDEEI